MFDPQTTLLIQGSPELRNFDRERLPEEFTKSFAAIVSFRLNISQIQERLPDELRQKLREFQRLAATFEGMVALLPQREDRRAAAFVAAQAQHLLFLARSASVGRERVQSLLRAEAIAPEISALLLFLIANQPSDATEMARNVQQLREEGDTVSTLLVDALCFFATGRLGALRPLDARVPPAQLEDLGEAASEALYRKLLKGLLLLADYLSDAVNFPGSGGDALGVFREVQRLASQEQIWPFDTSRNNAITPISTFPGPHHLATLLVAAAEYLGDSALSRQAVPPGVPASEWNRLIAPIIRQRPFLWPNHLEALKKGFLVPGTSSVISFPTGAGKTTLSELKTVTALARGGAVIYLAPTHALVDQIKVDLAASFPTIAVRDSLLAEDFYAEVGESFASNNAQIVVMTPERCLALLSLANGGFETVRLVIFDECHLIHPKIGGQNRRSLDAMLAILHLHEASPEADWLLLSAMMSNADEIAGWLGELTNRPCLALNLNWKPTRQARGCLVYQRDEIEKLQKTLTAEANKARRKAARIGNPGVVVKRQLQARPYGFFSLLQTWQTRDVRDYVLLPLINTSVTLSATDSPWNPGHWHLAPNKNAVASAIAAECVRIGLKVLLFVQSTRDAGAVAKSIGALANCDQNKPTFSDREQALFDVALDEAGAADAVLSPNGCTGCHHGNMLPAERGLVEKLFRRTGGIQAVAATATLAQGMNLPADIVLIVGDERFDAETEGFAPLDPHELLNAAGRAGRAGLVAQGLVVVIPHNFVHFDPQTNGIGSRWTQLQESVFSRADQCLPLQDPVQHYLDRIQDATSDTGADVRYFLRRLPRTSDANREAPTQFLRSTLAAWHARRANRQQSFENLIQTALTRRAVIDPLTGAETWRDEMAYRTGINIDFIEQLNTEVENRASSLPHQTESWIRWFFGWLGSDASRLDAVFSHRLPAKLQEAIGQGDLFGGKLADVIWGWMSGETLVALNARLGGKPNKHGTCDKARKFVLRMIPDFAFAVGLAARIRRHQIEEDAETRMPLVLGTLALCLREGFSDPELAALRVQRANEVLSRRKIRTSWEAIQSLAPPRNEFETFTRTRERVAVACDKWDLMKNPSR